MKFDFFAIYNNYPDSFSREDISHIVEHLHNHVPEKDDYELIDWDYWVDIPNITPTQAAYLLYAVDPDIAAVADTPIPRKKTESDLQTDIVRLERWLNGRSATWSLKQLIDTFGPDNLNTRMVNAVKTIEVPLKSNKTSINKQRDEFYAGWLEKGNITPEAIAKLTKEELQEKLMESEKDITGKSNLWSTNFHGWVKYTKLYNGINGRKKRN
jgi:hypothetical protein